MKKHDFRFLELVQESTLDEIQNNAETAIRARNTDINLVGICKGLGVTPTGNPLEVLIGSGVAYDIQGRRINIETDQIVNLTVSSAGVPLSLPAAGEEYYIVISVQFNTDLSAPATDGAGVEVFTDIDDGYEIFVRQNGSAPAGTAVYALPNDPEVVLGVIRIDSGTSIVPVSNIVETDRKLMFTATDGTSLIQGRNFEEAGESIIELINDTAVQIVNSLGDPNGAGLIGFTPVGLWAGDNFRLPADRRDLSPTTVEAGINDIVNTLAVEGFGNPDSSGAARIGYTPSVFARWADNTQISNNPGSNTVYGALNDIVIQLAAAEGADKIGYRNSFGALWADGTNLGGSLPPSDVQEAFSRVKTDLASDSSTNSGANKIGIRAFSSFPAQTLQERVELLSAGVSGTGTTVNITESWFGGQAVSTPNTTATSAINAVIRDIGNTGGAFRVGITATNTSAQNGVVRGQESLGNRVNVIQQTLTPTNFSNEWSAYQVLEQGYRFNNSTALGGAIISGRDSQYFPALPASTGSVQIALTPPPFFTGRTSAAGTIDLIISCEDGSSVSENGYTAIYKVIYTAYANGAGWDDASAQVLNHNAAFVGNVVTGYAPIRGVTLAHQSGTATPNQNGSGIQLTASGGNLFLGLPSLPGTTVQISCILDYTLHHLDP